jgi:serine/threonine protein phosphatase 1
MKTFVLGDIHGTYKAMLQCFERSGFDYHKDRLIVLGDVCDGYPQVNESIEELLKVKHCIYIIGNHDLWALEWGLHGLLDEMWLPQGGYATVESYRNKPMPKSHVDFLSQGLPWFEDEERIFVHGGFNPQEPLSVQNKSDLTWNRELIEEAFRANQINPDYRFSAYKEIYVGHTTTQVFGSTNPLKLCNIWAMDTGAGWSGKLSIMDIHTKEFWQSDPTPEIYQGYMKRGH